MDGGTEFRRNNEKAKFTKSNKQQDVEESSHRLRLEEVILNLCLPFRFLCNKIPVTVNCCCLNIHQRSDMIGNSYGGCHEILVRKHSDSIWWNVCSNYFLAFRQPSTLQKRSLFFHYCFFKILQRNMCLMTWNCATSFYTQSKICECRFQFLGFT